MKHTRMVKSLFALAVVLVWAALPVLAADEPACEKKAGCPMMKALGLNPEQEAKIMEMNKAHREAVRALLNDEQKKKFDEMEKHMQATMMPEHGCKMAEHKCDKAAHECKMKGHKCSAECKCPCMKDGKCACVKKDGKCACPATCACMKDGKCTCTCGEGKCVAHAQAMTGGCHKKAEAEVKACAKTCATPCTKKEKQE